ncbi:hypothetical protein AMJ49_03910 [Parcubacteria bacterium DG_74_2]|nr:MAG: hypothetical protein AMJ49_03910 [Parcubacteria bacterium DG_74_2]
MLLKQRIQGDLTEAVKRGEEITRSVLRMLIASITAKEKEKRYKLIKTQEELGQEEIEKQSELTNEEVIQLLQSEIKKRKEAVLGFEKGGKSDLAEKEKKEKEILEKYLPEQLSEEEIKKLAQEAIETTGVNTIKDIGKVMGELMPKIKGRAEGGKASEIVKKLLT